MSFERADIVDKQGTKTLFLFFRCIFSNLKSDTCIKPKDALNFYRLLIFIRQNMPLILQPLY